MQKLIRRSPSGLPLLCTSSIKPSLSFLSLSLSLAFSFPATNSTRFTMPTAALSGSGLALAAAAALTNKNPSFSRRFYTTSTCSIYQPCSNARTHLRGWPGRIGIRPARCHSGGVEEALGPVEGSKSLGDEEGKEEEGKPMRLNRRQKGSGVLVGSPDLLTIPGVGPRNLRKLVENGIQGVAELKQLYKDKFFGKASQKMVEFLQSSVGIIHRNHAESITTFIKESVDEELKDSDSDVKPAAKKRLTFCVEGNISVGKTTFLQRIANETLELRDLVEIVPEPIDKWQNVGPDHFNILDAFYAEPERYAYTFQNYVFVTRVMQERESSGGIKPLRLMERSVFSDRMVFVRAVHEANWMNEMEISIYDSWFDPVVSCLPGLIPDGFIYLRASPDTCHKRMMLRKRAEEGGVSLDYLRDLHEKHESWLFPFQSGNHGVLSVSKLPVHMDSSLHPDIRDRVFYLEGNHMHSSIQKVPALVLDCEPNIDFSRDIEAKRQYARQVAEFFEFVKKKKEVSSTKAGEEGQVNSQPQILLPHAGGLWVADGKHFPDSALKSLDFRRAMSFMSGSG
ncbi:P-loop containing nucleoside triphosphate hydrolases superfamily protein isoform 1 [Theobroma cacao]|uniref:P-loop containing nucleoside triphosphate hydrolases superfamily protein isoform 1 n=4 Tax=Theobroma cacao TaxID=3641 RepID=A0A061FJL3_THECC|nr:P-loop containing nucleoside triphosphate hydrolases superfamily protein isoform 1 [Theobroma cacao]